MGCKDQTKKEKVSNITRSLGVEGVFLEENGETWVNGFQWTLRLGREKNFKKQWDKTT